MPADIASAVFVRRYERLGLPQPTEATDEAIARCTVLDTEVGAKMRSENGRGGVVDLVQRSKWIGAQG